ncbi:2-phosphosulfolactate phosphatase [Planococcus sp. YIM B11945]|uniref:2-phosphosulfolactate phosphatase n=1 Tax=Planococcus sp. YIM B11945 TaxID=3435410 RepID=UPI003D7DA3E3
MPKLHLLLKKEEIDEMKMQENKTAVIFDVLLATSTIAACFWHGAKDVVPVLNEAEARQQAKGLVAGSFCLAGEYNGKTIEGFLDPNPVGLKAHTAGKTVVLSTTNGTVAIRKAANAKKVYTASLLNGEAAAKKIVEEHRDETIVAVCSGSGGEFCMEDFYGAGFFIDCVMEKSSHWELTDSAKAARIFYQSNKAQARAILNESRVGAMLLRHGFEEEIEFIAQTRKIQAVPWLEKGKLVAD